MIRIKLLLHCIYSLLFLSNAALNEAQDSLDNIREFYQPVQTPLDKPKTISLVRSAKFLPVSISKDYPYEEIE